MRQIVSDTGPLLHLTEAGALDLLGQAGKTAIPRMVAQELLSLKDILPDLPWLAVRDLSDTATAQATAWHQAGLLDAGEAEALALALQLKADWFLTDDAAARLLGQSLGVEVHGSLAVALWAAANGLLSKSEAFAVIDRLSRSSLWVSDRVLREAKAALDLLFSTE